MDDISQLDHTVLLRKVFDAGTNNIWSEMQKLRGQSIEEKRNTRKRWIWELIQNASDCIEEEEKVNINIELKDNYLDFKHDGRPFTYENLVDLITQISSKQSCEEDKTGKFGTGFMSTHLLSEKVGIKGVLMQDDATYKDLFFVLDRSGNSYQEVRENIETNLNLIEKLKQDNTCIITKPKKNETVFRYKRDVSEETKKAIKAGLDDLRDTIPFVLAFNSCIESITSENIKYEVFKMEELENIECKIITIKSSIDNIYHVLLKQCNNVYIAIMIEENSNGSYNILPINKDMPKLFCKFPLVGTEDYSFPVIINAPEFDVQKDRNAIFEGNENNIQIINTAISLYESLIKIACENNWLNLYNLCKINKNPTSSVQEKNNNIIKGIYEFINIVDVNLCEEYVGRSAIKTYDNAEGIEKNLIGIPYTRKEERDLFWELINVLGYLRIPTKESYVQWNSIIETKIEIRNINNWLLKDKELVDFKNTFKGKSDDVFSWLNKYYQLWITIEGKEDFINEAYVLNQNFKFVKVSDIYLDLNINNDFKEILYDLGEDIRECLLAKEISLDSSIISRKYDNKYVIERIQREVDRIIANETINNSKREQCTQLLFNKITNWFLEHPQESEELFDTLYNKRNLLSTAEENLRRYKITEKLDEHHISDIELDGMILNRNVIVNLIENMDVLSSEEIKKQLKHVSKNSIYGYEKYMEMQERAIRNVHTYFSLNNRYTITDSLDKWKNSSYCNTVFKVKKDDMNISIVIRPSDGDKIILFNGEELEILDSDNYELWTDDGKNHPRKVTLGDILKTTGINLIPLRNIFKNTNENA